MSLRAAGTRGRRGTHLLVEHGLGLTTVAALLAVVTPLPCAQSRRAPPVRSLSSALRGAAQEETRGCTAPHGDLARPRVQCRWHGGDKNCGVGTAATTPGGLLTRSPVWSRRRGHGRRTLSVQRGLARLVLGHLVHLVLLARLALAVRLLGLGDVHLHPVPGPSPHQHCTATRHRWATQ
jgi:hypothetical protein